MKKTVVLFGILMLGLTLFGGTSSEAGQPQENRGEQKDGIKQDQDLAIKFLQGIQNGDKNKMYEAANLTIDIVNDSRDKLVHSKQNKLTEQQRAESEYALRISGQIDFFIAKMRMMFPKSSRFEITQGKVESSTDGTSHSMHRVQITYLNKSEAMRDKTGKPVKEMVVHLQQVDRSVNGRSLHEFSFTGKDFEKFANRDFEVLSYF